MNNKKPNLVNPVFARCGKALLTAAIVVATNPIASVSAQGASALEEIVVTARKREENVQDTPIAISAFSGDGLENRGVADLSSLDNFTPNLVINRSPASSGVSNAAVFIRGIGQNDFVPVIDPGVGIYVDGVYLGRSVGGVLDIVDLERVEVLRGPQGTLFGRNTIGGAISLTSKRPTEEFSGRVDAKVGTDSRADLKASFNVPFSENFLSRISLATLNQDGYVERPDGVDLGDDNTKAARFTGLWTPSDNVEVTFSADYSDDNENGPPQILTGIEVINPGLFLPNGAPSQGVANNTIRAQGLDGGIRPGGTFFDPAAPSGFPFNAAACFVPANVNNPACYNQRFIQEAGGTQNFGTDEAKSDLETFGASVTVAWDINDNLQFKSITSIRSLDGEFINDNDQSPQPVTLLIDLYEQDQFTQEFQLLGTALDEKLKWILGAYYFEEDGFNINPVRFALVDIQSGGFFDSDSFAVFGQATYDFNDQFSATLGLRYTEDTKRYTPDQFFERFPLAQFGFPLELELPPCPGTGAPCQIGDRVLPLEQRTAEADEVTPMLNLTYRVNDSLLTYATYSEGFKGGGFTQRIFPPEGSLPSFEPEFAESYELGFKYDSANGNFRLNGAVFKTDYTDIQLSVADPSRVGPFITNAGDTEYTGLELEMQWIPAESWFVSASVGYLDPERTRVGDGVLGLTLDSRIENVADTNANIQITKEIDLGGSGILTPRVEWVYRSEFGTNVVNVPFEGESATPFGVGTQLGTGTPLPRLFQDDYDVFNASIRWENVDSNISLTVGVDNIGDEEYRTFGSYQDAFSSVLEIFDRGRQWYVRGTYEF